MLKQNASTKETAYLVELESHIERIGRCRGFGAMQAAKLIDRRHQKMPLWRKCLVYGIFACLPE